MADFQSTAPLHNKLNAMNRHRREESGDHYSRGIECLLLAEDDDFEDRSLLLEACDCFIDAIRYNRQHTDAYVAMAYLLGLIGSHEEAMNYTQEALRIDPHHSDIPLLIRFIKGKAPPLDNIPADNSPLGLMKAKMDSVLADLTAENVNAIAPSLNELVVQRLAEKAQFWEQRYHRLRQELAALKDSRGTSLQAALASILHHSERYQAALQGSQHMAELAEQLQEHNQQIEQAFAVLAAGEQLGSEQDYINTWLDNCDYFAETLEQWETAGWNIKSLNRQYETLCDQLEALQDRLGL